MAYLLTKCNEFLAYRNNEAVDYNKIKCLREKISALTKRYYQEKDYKKKRKLQMQINICNIQISMAQLD